MRRWYSAAEGRTSPSGSWASASLGLLVSSIGVGLIVAGYFYPDDSAGITKAVEEFEKK